MSSKALAPPNYFMEVASYCSCVLPEGCRGTTGWHMKQTQHPITGADQVTAYERCPAYWQTHGRQVDPSDRRQLLEIAKSKAKAGVKA